MLLTLTSYSNNNDDITNTKGINPCLTVNKKTLYEQIIKLNIQFPYVVLSQAIYESGHFKSNICKLNNNLFGMTLAKSRKTTAVGKNKKYAVYTDWIESVKDYKLWQEEIPKKYKKNEKIYLLYLQRNYSKTSNYAKMLKKMNTH